jgi:lysine N6-hydroxylase
MWTVSTTPDVYDIIGVGAGPSNLSLAALAESVPDLQIAVLERRESFAWHPGIMLSGVTVGTAPVKDLVTLVDPTNRHSFLNFLVEKGRIYRFLIAHNTSVSRREFSQYYSWAADRLPSVLFGIDVRGIDHDGSTFAVDTSKGVWRARNIVLGIGHVPHVPKFARDKLCPDVFHSSEFLLNERIVAGRDVLLVGGGQSASEIACHILSDDEKLPRRFTWVSGRSGFLPLDDSPFSNEWFNPSYVGYFHSLNRARRRELLGQHLLSSDGAWEPLLLTIYRRLYALDYLFDRPFSYELLSGHRVIDLVSTGSSYKATVQSPDTKEHAVTRADVVILATGYRTTLPEFFHPISDRITLSEDEPSVDPVFGVEWDGPCENRMYLQNGARQTHGVADSNLSVAAWRSAVILNDVCGRSIYPTTGNDITLGLSSSSP